VSRAFRFLPLLAAVVAVAAPSGCSERGIEETPELPVLTGLEPAVVEKIRSLHAHVLAERSVASWTRWAKTLHAHEMMEEALRAYRVAAAHAKVPDTFELLYLAGHSSAKRDPEQAVVLFAEAEKVRDDYVPLHLRAGEIHLAARRVGEARRHFERALALCESASGADAPFAPTTHALLGLGRIALAEGRTGDAIAVLERGQRLKPEHEEILAALANAYARAGRAADAATVSAQVGDLEDPRGYPDPIATAMAREGVSYLSLSRLGIAALRSYEFEQALGVFERALALRPDDLDALFNRAQALVGLGRYAEAEPILDRVIAERPPGVTALTMRAGCAMSRNDLTAAAALLRKAVEVSPRQVDTRANLGRVLVSLGQPAEARRHFEAVLERRPHRADIRVDLASILLEQGDAARATAEVDRVLAANPGHKRAQALKAKLPK
jgi:tetratricopeptide (TPR) repeat protein